MFLIIGGFFNHINAKNNANSWYKTFSDAEINRIDIFNVTNL